MATDTKFTPGPWLVSAAQGGWNCVRSQSHEGPIICGPSGMNNDANWHLIAAAPDLYEVVRRYVASRQGGEHLLFAAEAALAKAGEK